MNFKTIDGFMLLELSFKSRGGEGCRAICIQFLDQLFELFFNSISCKLPLFSYLNLYFMGARVRVLSICTLSRMLLVSPILQYSYYSFIHSLVVF